MPRRTLITASLLVLVLALIVFLPYFPPVRGLIVERVTTAFSDAGIDVTFDSSSGNAWRGVTLEGVTIEGAGSDVQVDRLRVGYFLPSLLGGELPLDVTVSGASGTVDLEQLLDDAVAEPGAAPSRSISLRLRRLDLHDIEVDVEQLPFTLPDTNLRELDVTQDGTNLLLRGVISTPDGEAEVSGRYESLTGSATIQVERADATIGQHWWGGITGGQVTGELRVRGTGIEGDLVVSDASVDAAGLHASAVDGEITLQLPVISAELRGAALGGPVEATGVVNVQARRWEASGTAQPALGEAVDWLARSQFPGGVPLDVTGTSEVQLSLAGWRDFTLDGSATGAGAVADVPVEDLRTTFRLPADGQLRADGSASLGGGPVDFAVAPSPSGDRLTLDAQGIGLEAIRAGLGEIDASLDIGMGPDGNGTVSASWEGDVAGRDLQASLDATLDADGWQGFVTASDDTGFAAEGALVLANGRLEGRLTSDQLGTDLLTPGGRVAVAVDGALQGGLGGLNVTVSVDGPQPVHVTALPDDVASTFDLRGSATGVLDLGGPDGPAIRGLSGEFGPVAVAGDVVFSPLRADLNLSVAALPLEAATGGGGGPGGANVAGAADPGPSAVAGTIWVPSSTLVADAGGVSWNGSIAYESVSIGPARLGSGGIDATFSLPTGGPWSLVGNSNSGDLVVTADAAGFDVTLDGLPVVVGDDVVAADLSGSIAGTLAGAAADENASPAPIAVELTIDNAAGADPQVELPGSLDLSGQVEIAASRATFDGVFTGAASQPTPLFTADAVPLAVEVAWGGGGVTASVSLDGVPTAAEPLRATYEGATGRFSLTGAADLGQFTTATDGLLTSDLSGTLTATGLGDLTGSAMVATQRPTPLTVTFDGDGDEISVTVQGGPDDVPISATGTIDVASFATLAEREGALLTASVGPLNGIGVGLSGATGSGTLEPLALGPVAVPAVPWSLDAAWGGDAPPRATVTLAGSPVEVALVEGGLIIAGSLAVPVAYGGEEYVLNASVPGGRVVLNDLEATPLAGTLTHLGSETSDGAADGTASEVLSIDGTVAELTIDGALPTAQLVPMVPSSSRPTGLLKVSGNVSPLDGPTYQADVELTAELPPDARQALPEQARDEAGPVTLRGTVAGTGTDLRAQLTGEGLSFSYADGVLDLVATDARLEPLVGLPGSIDGSLALDSQSTWSGSLTVTAIVGLGGEEPVTAEALLAGRGDTLAVDAHVTGPLESWLEATGTLTPALDVEGRFEAAGGVVSGTLQYSSASGLAAELASPELLVEDYMTVPPIAATFSMPPGEPLRLSGEGIDVRADLATGELSGDIALPFTLLGSPAELTAALGGTISEPQASAEVTGDGLEIEAVANLETAQADLTLDPAVAATLVPAAAALTSAVAEPVQAVARWSSDEGWQLRAVATATVPAAEEQTTVDLELSLTGEADQYAGAISAYLVESGRSAAATPSANLEPATDRPPAIATATVAGIGGDLAAELDLASIDWSAIGAAFDVAVDLEAAGSARLSTQPFNASLDIDIRGEVEGVAVSLSGSAPDDLDLTLASDEIDLTARLAWNEERRAVLEGSIQGRPVEGWLELADDLSTGRLSLDTPGVAAEATLTTVAEVRTVAVSASLGGEEAGGSAGAEVAGAVASSATIFGGVRGDLAASVTLDGGAVDLTDLSATIDQLPGLGEGQPLLLTASGPLSPQIDVTGTLVVPDLDQTAEIRVAGEPVNEELMATVAWQDLDLSYVFAEGHLTLTGDASLGAELAPYLPEELAGLELTVDDADLTWRPPGSAGGDAPGAAAAEELGDEPSDEPADETAGFSGGLTASINAPMLAAYGVPGPVTLTAQAAPTEDSTAPTPLMLTLDASAEPGDGAQATAQLTLVVPGAFGPPADLPLTGNLSLAASLPEQNQRLTVDAAIGGTFASPVLDGEITGMGPIEATGTIQVVNGRGALSLSGPHLAVDAAGSLDEWSVNLGLSRLPLAEWLPQVAEPRLSLNASAASGSGGATIDGLAFESRASSLTGAATIRDGVRVSLQAQVDLSDLQLGGTELTGLMRGPMVVTAPSLAGLADANVTAQLDAAGVGLEAVDATVNGVLQLGGKVSDPSISALLSGNGVLSGSLRLDTAPTRGRLELRSTLAAAGLTTDLRVSVTPETASASGQARYQGAVLLLSDGPAGIELTGAGRIDGWQAVVAPDLASLTASGPLSAIAPSVSGEIDLTVGGREATGEGAPADTQDEPWLSATVAGVEVAGQPLADLTLSAQEPGAEVVVQGEGLAASVNPSDLSWTLAIDELALPASLSVSLAGSGQGASGRVEGTVWSGTGAAADGQGGPADVLGLDVEFTASLGAGAASLGAGAAPLGGGADRAAGEDAQGSGAAAPTNPVATGAPATITVDGRALGGDLRISGARAATGAWDGDVSLTGASIADIDLAANGVLQGQGGLPQAVIATAAFGGGEMPVSVAGRVSLGGSGVSFDQTAALPMLTAPLRLQGQVVPNLDVTLSASPRGANAAPENAPRGSTRVFVSGGGLRASGEMVLPLGPVTVIVDGGGPDSSPRLAVRLAAAPSVAAEAPLVARDLGDLLALINDGGLTFTGTDAAHGALRVGLEPSPSAVLDGFGVDLAGFDLALSGRVSPSSADLSGRLRLPLDLPAGAQAAGQELPLQVTTEDGTWTVTSSGELGDLAASYDLGTNALTLDVDLALPATEAPVEAGLDQGLSSGAVVGRITYDPVNGPAGTLALADVSLNPGGIGELTLNADAAIADGRIGGSATLDTAGGRVSVNGNAGLDELFPGLASPEQADAPGSNLELRVRTLELQEFPVIASAAPYLSGALSGVVQLRNGFMLGQLVAPELAVGERPVPASLQLSGPPNNLDAALQLAGSLFTADLGGGRIAGSSRLERFPLDLLGEAFVGPTDVTAFLTGVLRFDLPSTDPAAGYMRLATEEITLERAGVTTNGEVALTYEDRVLSVQNAEFGGEGAWHAEGVLGPDLLDFTLEANDADFSPLLGLVPALSRFGVGAAGSFTFVAAGDFASPQVSLVSDTLDVSVAGTRFRIEDTDVSLIGDDLSATTTVRGLDPVEGAIQFSGEATVMLEPLALRSVDFGFSGELDVPGIGLVGDLRGTISQNPQNLPVLFMTGDLGEPLTVQGTLAPLDLQANGDGLQLSLPSLLIANATVSADLSLQSEAGGVVLGGAIEATEVVVDPAVRGAAGEADAAAQGEAAPQGDAAAQDEAAPSDALSTEPESEPAAPPVDTSVAPPASPPTAEEVVTPGTPAEETPAVKTPADETPAVGALTDLPPIESAIEQLEPADDSALVSTPSVADAGAQGARNAMAAIRFDDLRITAPQRVLLSMSIASLEASLDLTLTGTAADPRLSGEARALRGSLRFSGREFTVDRAVASFSPSRGVLPELDVAAHAEFEKSRVLAGATDVEFVAPSEGSTFTVELSFAGPVEIEDDADGGIRFDIRPVLSSDALVEISGEGVGTGVRPLTEAELLSLITLGRIEFGSDLIGAGGLGGAVAQGALDTAVDLLVVGEIQNALREALGLDVVEIRTTAISSLLGGEGAQPFGVSVRLGGYLNPELFASYRIGTADPNDPGFGFTNEVALRYGLGPLNLDVLGRIDFPVAGTLNNPRSELGVGVSYDFGRALSIDTGVTLSTQRSVVSFGVALRW